MVLKTLACCGPPLPCKVINLLLSTPPKLLIPYSCSASVNRAQFFFFFFCDTVASVPHEDAAYVGVPVHTD